MNGTTMQLFRRLGDGEFHSGVALAAELGVTRSAIWKSVRGLEALGAEIHAVPNRGYRLHRGAGGGPLDAATILAALPAEARGRVAALDVAWSIPSTNAALLARPEPTPGLALVLLAEHQSAGRGRRGRSWLAPLGGALCLSIGWTFPQLPREIAALSLVVGVSVRRALVAAGVAGVGLKWPNDLVARERKLGGILIELRAEAGGPGHVVIGLGLNVALGAAQRAELEAVGATATDLVTLGIPRVDRNELAGALVGAIVADLPRFATEGIAAFAADWSAADVLRGRPVRVESGAAVLHGIARGIDAGGALQVETANGMERFLSAEVTVRAEAGAPGGV